MAVGSMHGSDALRERDRVALWRVLPVVASACTDELAADVLGLTLEELHAAVARGELSTIGLMGLVLVPAWQMEPRAPGGLLPELGRLLAATAGRPDRDALLATFLLRRAALLGGRTARRAWVEGDRDAVLELLTARIEEMP